MYSVSFFTEVGAIASIPFFLSNLYSVSVRLFFFTRIFSVSFSSFRKSTSAFSRVYANRMNSRISVSIIAFRFRFNYANKSVLHTYPSSFSSYNMNNRRVFSLCVRFNNFSSIRVYKMKSTFAGTSMNESNLSIMLSSYRRNKYALIAVLVVRILPIDYESYTPESFLNIYCVPASFKPSFM